MSDSTSPRTITSLAQDLQELREALNAHVQADREVRELDAAALERRLARLAARIEDLERTLDQVERGRLADLEDRLYALERAADRSGRW